MTHNKVRRLLNKAITIFYERDAVLAKMSGTERTCVAKIAHYLQQLIDQQPKTNNLCVDCEYGRVTTQTGQLYKKYMDTEVAYSDNRDNHDRIFPDIIVHERETHKNNLLVVEVKGWWNAENWGNDETELQVLTRSKHTRFGTSLKDYICYRHGTFVVLGHSKAYFIDFENGQQITSDISVSELQNKRNDL